MTNNINGIDVSEYFINHYDNSGKLYAVEYKGNPLELQNAIKRLQEENEGLKSLNDFNVQKIKVLQKENEELKKRQITKNGFICDCEQNAKYKQALEEIKNIAELDVCYNAKLDKYTFSTYAQRILDTINEVLNDRD